MYLTKILKRNWFKVGEFKLLRWYTSIYIIIKIKTFYTRHHRRETIKYLNTTDVMDDEYSLSHQSSDSSSLFSSSSSSLPPISPTKTSAIRTSASNDSSFKPLLKYFVHCFKILVLTFVFDWTQLVRHPVASFATLTMYPTACLVMAVVAVAFYIAEKYGLRQTNNNLSICNWCMYGVWLMKTSSQVYIHLDIPCLTGFYLYCFIQFIQRCLIKTRRLL